MRTYEELRDWERIDKPQIDAMAKVMDFVHDTIDKKDPDEVFCDSCCKEIGLTEHYEIDGEILCRDCAEISIDEKHFLICSECEKEILGKSNDYIVVNCVVICQDCNRRVLDEQTEHLRELEEQI